MKISVKKSTMVKPTEETPSGSLWLSNLDSVMPAAYYSRCVFFFRSNGAVNFFDAEVLKAALSRSLVEFYPYAGRLRKDNDGRIEINCSGEGALFLEAECDTTVEELRGFTLKTDAALIPKVDYSHGLSTFPLLLIQLTRFKCGGVSLGVAFEHHVSDGVGGLQYMNTWSVIARGNLTATGTQPFLDRRILLARNPPQPHFPHIEQQPPPSLKTPLDVDINETSFRTFNLTPDQIKALKQKCNDKRKKSYTTYEVIAGHVWRSACLARRLPHDQETKLHFSVDARQRMRPPLPPRFFGNGIFYTAALASYGEMESDPLSSAVEKVHEAVVRMDDDYMRSALDYMELQLQKSQSIVHTASSVQCPNFGISTWLRLPFYQVDFGWGKPIFAGPGEAFVEGRSYLFTDPENEGGVLLAITLLKPHMETFQDLIYQI